MATKQATEEFERTALALYEGRIDANEFMRRTRVKWQRTGGYLFERWRRKLPAWVEPEDIAQELAMLALKYVAKWNPARGAKIGRYVEWGAIHRAQRVLNTWRGASTSGNEGKNPSRAEIAFTRAFGPETDPLAMLGQVEADQEGAAAKAEQFAELLEACATVREAIALLALRATDGSIAAAAALLYGDFGARVECAVRSEEEARRLVGESVAGLLARERQAEAMLPPADLFDLECDEENAA